jgi:ligand-binding sensor domain-containing protein
MLNYTRGLDVAQIDDAIYVASSNSIFIYNKTDNSLETLTRINGLSDIGIILLHAIPGQQTVLIGYENGNIDLLQNKQIINVPDVRNSSIAGNKEIRHAHTGSEFVYLSTGLGILAFDIERREIRDTYGIAANEVISVNETAILNDTLYAATDQGLFFGSLSDDLTIFNNWQMDLSIPLPFDPVINCTSSGGVLFINQPQAPVPGLYGKFGESWQLSQGSNDIRSVRAVPNGLVMSTFSTVVLRSANGADLISNFGNYSGEPARPSRIHVDQEGTFWIADLNFGLVKWRADSDFAFIAPDGPASNGCFTLNFVRDELWVASGAPTRPGLWGNSNNLQGFYRLKDRKWTNFTPLNLPIIDEETFLDVTQIYRYPQQEERVLVSSWYSGVIEMINGEVINHFTTSNSSLQPWTLLNRPDGKDWIGVTAFTPDDEGNVWMLNSRNDTPLAVYRNDGTWKSFEVDGITNSQVVTHMIINQQGHHWMLVNRQGVVVYDTAGDIDSDAAHQTVSLNAQEGQGGLPSNEVYCIVEDLDGVIWVGSSDGIGVFFSPFDVFTTSRSDSRPILVEQDGIFQPLFENQAISVIRVDGANRKWVGTYGSGVFLMSPDGTEQLLNFTRENSPLLSNTIEDIAINAKTGEVYIGTQEGIMVYGGDATQGQFTNNCTSVYPNPVRENYTGSISITGLMRDTEVRITDMRGYLVASIVSNGGTAVWDGRNQNNQRVATGVYFALSANADGTSTCTSKILMIK